jgi:hypothetical protein
LRKEKDMFRANLLAALAATLALAGCASHRFQLTDVERLKPGVSTRAQVEKLLGPPCEPPSGQAGILQVVERDARIHLVSGFRGADGGRVLYLSEERRYNPSPAAAWFVWPVCICSTLQGYAVIATFDQDERLVDATLTVSWFTPTPLYLLVIPGQPSIGGTLTLRDAETLKRIERNGIWVAVSPCTLREYLRRHPIEGVSPSGPTAAAAGSR